MNPTGENEFSTRLQYSRSAVNVILLLKTNHTFKNWVTLDSTK